MRKLASAKSVSSIRLSAHNDLAVSRAKVADRLVKHGKQALERLIFAMAEEVGVAAIIGRRHARALLHSDSPLPNPPDSYMLSSKVFADMEQGKMWNFK